ncbi:PEP-CTERM sorting domain-containing protein [Gloeothece verrucosa]|uniref:PEP-CTERM protein-sorting domain-containing protein n=1 Tax=Gloeothece verrucosa (strain PCC 7822) TaxID=497965 RepID=E0UHP2_GLOV7|nr:PEP-CTERM sorting domain-containing protein [Gloeothece verrucosa]ADN13299.1 hypothetical protein Cyan7822_1297 [Gloeothece verrucosa PCC 7822]
MINIKHLMTTTSGAVLISTLLVPNPSLAVNIKTWNLKFFDGTNKLVGTGEFSYNQDQRYFIQTNIYSEEWYYENGYYDQQTGEILPPPPKGFKVKTLLTNFEATIKLRPLFFDPQGGTDVDFVVDSWGLDNLGVRWWKDPSVPVSMGNQYYDDYDYYDEEYVVESGWVFGQTRHEGYHYFSMYSPEVGFNKVVRGSWNAINYGEPNYQDSGTWTATLQGTPMPEPLTLLGTSTAIGFGLLFKKKVSK